MWPLALLVFVASMLVPCFKLASLTFMLIDDASPLRLAAA